MFVIQNSWSWLYLLRMRRMDFRLCLLWIVLMYTFQCQFGGCHSGLSKIVQLFFLVGIWYSNVMLFEIFGCLVFFEYVPSNGYDKQWFFSWWFFLLVLHVLFDYYGRRQMRPCFALWVVHISAIVFCWL
jgi:hypothetical protein